MRIVIEETGQVIGFDQLAKVNFRTDLIPVPVNLEMVVKADAELEKRLKENAVVQVGDDQIRLTIIKVLHANTQTVIEDKRFKAIAIIAVLAGCETLIDPLSKAVILSGASFASAYRACGCKLTFNKDIPISSFASAYGSIPTIEIATCLQEESAVIQFDGKKLNAHRLSELLNKEPVMLLDNSAISWINNTKVEQRQNPNYISVGEDGKTVEGVKKSNAPAKYYADTDARRLKNLTKVLITRGTVTRTMDLSVFAGDVVQVDDTKYLVLTASHLFNTGALGGGNAAASRFWLASLSS